MREKKQMGTDCDDGALNKKLFAWLASAVGCCSDLKKTFDSSSDLYIDTHHTIHK